MYFDIYTTQQQFLFGASFILTTETVLVCNQFSQSTISSHCYIIFRVIFFVLIKWRNIALVKHGP